MTPVNSEIVPTGKLRVGLNGSNAILVACAADGSVSGIAVDLGKFIAGKLDEPFEQIIEYFFKHDVSTVK